MDCRDERLRLPHAGDRRRRRRAAPESGARRPSASAAPSTARCRCARATPPTRAATRSGTARSRSIVGIDELNRAQSIPRGRHGDAQRHLERERDGGRRPRASIGYWHPGPAPAAPAPLRRAPALPRHRRGRVARPARPREDAARRSTPSRAGSPTGTTCRRRAGRPATRESQERLSGPLPPRRSSCSASCARRRRKPSFEAARRTSIRYVGTTAQQRPLALVRLRRAQRGRQGRRQAVLDAHRGLGRHLPPRRRRRARSIPASRSGRSSRTSSSCVALAQAQHGHARCSSRWPPTPAPRTCSTSQTARPTRSARPRRAEWRTAADATFAALEKRFGTADVAKWREPRRLYPWQRPGRRLTAADCRSSTAGPGSSSSNSGPSVEAGSDQPDRGTSWG